MKHIYTRAGLWVSVFVVLCGNAAVPRARAEPPADVRAVVRISGPTGPSCSGTLIAAKTVLTAAHCVTRRNGGVHSPGLFHVALSPGPDALPEIRKVSAIRRAPDYDPDAASSAGRLENDWAVLTVERGFPAAGPPIRLLPAAEAGARVRAGTESFVRAYGRARAITPHPLAACAVLAVEPPIIEHDCPLEPGASGSGLLVRHRGEIRVVGVNVARHNEGARTRGVTAMVPALETDD